MNYTGNTNSSTAPLHNAILSPAAKEAKRIIPQNIVKERARFYDELIHQARAPKDHRRQLAAIAQDALKSKDNGNYSDTPSLVENM